MRSSEFRRSSGFFGTGFVLTGVGWLILLIAGSTASYDPWEGRSSGSEAWAVLAVIAFVSAFIALAIGTVRLVKNFDIANYYHAIQLGRLEYPQAAVQQAVTQAQPVATPATTSGFEEYKAPTPPAPPAPPAP